jgi:hypothetical protein
LFWKAGNLGEVFAAIFALASLEAWFEVALFVPGQPRVRRKLAAIVAANADAEFDWHAIPAEQMVEHC